jgi:hypothetical protein
MPFETRTDLEPRVKECIQDCLDCFRACEEALPHCLAHGGRHTDPDHIAVLLDSAGLCQTAASSMMRGSPLHWQICGVCATFCERCAESCEQLGGTVMEACARACRACVSSCRTLSRTKT